MEGECTSVISQSSQQSEQRKKGAHRDKLEDFVNNNHRRADR